MVCKELEPDTYQLAVSNILISSGHMFDTSLVKGDSIREPITRKFDNILANPPYEITNRKIPRRCFDVFLGKNNYMKLQIEKYQE